MENNFKEQLGLLYKFKYELKKSDENYQELVTEIRTILIPKKSAIKAINSSIAHYRSRINYIEQNK
jgi:phosphopantetheine adenylyltransferase